MALTDLNTLINATGQNFSQFKGLTAAYQVLLGGVPTIDGYTYLINNNNTTNFGAGGTVVFNDENIYINTANALYQGNPTAKANFDALLVGAASIQDKLVAIYNFVVPEIARSTAGLDYFLSQAAYYTQRAGELGIVGANGPAVVAFAALMKISVDGDIPGLGDDINDLLAAVGNGTALIPQSGTDLTEIETADGVAFDGDDVAAVTGQTFTLTNNPDAFTGGDGKDTFIASETTLSSADVLNGGGGSEDVLRYASSGAAAVVESGFTATNIETILVTSDATGGTNFDVTGVSGATSLVNSNSSNSLALTGLGNTIAVTVENVSQAAGPGIIGTDVIYKDTAVAGAADSQTLILNNNTTLGGGAIADIRIGKSDLSGTGIETLNIQTTGGATKVNDIISNAKTVNVSGDQNLTVVDTLNGSTLIDASAFKGALNVKADSGALAVVVKGGLGNDTADFSLGFGAGDSFDGGAGTDTIGLTNALATGALGGTTANVEQVNVTDAGAGTLDASKFAGVTRITYDAGLGAATAVSKASDALTVEVDVQGAAQNLTVTHATDTATNVITIDLDDIQTGDAIGTVKAQDAETVNLVVDWDATAGLPNTGTLAVAALDFADATKIVVSGDAKTTVAGFVAPATPTVTTFDASAHSNGLVLTGLGGVLAAAGSTVTLGAGDDTLTNGTGVGADSVTLGTGKDTIVYTALNQSSGSKVDTVQDFTQGQDIIDVSANLLGKGGIVASNQFVGNFANFGSAQGSLTANDGIVQAVFQQDTNTLWVDSNDDGTLNANDLQVVLKGVTTLTTADLGFVVGNTITLTAPGATVNAATKVNADNFTTKGDDTINSIVANLAGSVVDGLAGTDTLVVTDGNTVATTFLGAGFTNIENVTLTAATWLDVSANAGVVKVTGSTGNDRIAIAGAQQADGGDGDDRVTFSGVSTAATSLKGGNGTDTLSLVNGSDISNVTAANFSGLELLRLDNNGIAATYTMTRDQHESFLLFSSVGAGTDTVTLTTSGTVFGRGVVESYQLAGGDDTFTAALASQNVNGGGGDDTLIYSGTLTGNINGGGGTNTLRLSATSNVTAATLAGLDIFQIQDNSTLTINAAQLGGQNVIGIGTLSANLVITGAGNANINELAGVVTIDATGMADNATLSIDDDTAGADVVVNIGDSDFSLAASFANDQYTVNAAGGVANQSINTVGFAGNRTTGVDIINVNGASAHTISTGSGDDVISFATGAGLTNADVIDGGAGNDTLNINDAPAATDIDGVTNVEVFNFNSGLADTITPADSVVAAGSSATFNLSTGGATADFSAEVDGQVNVVLRGGTNTITMTANNVVDTYTAAAGNDSFKVNANNTVANLANVDVITNFQAGGDDAIDTGNVGVGTWTVNVAGTSLAGFIGSVNTALNSIVGYAAADAQYDAIIVNVTGSGALDGQYFIQDTTAALGIDATAVAVKLVGAGIISAADFV